MPATFITLPIELIELIGTKCGGPRLPFEDCTDLLNLRLTCRTIQRATHLHFVKTFMGTRRVTLESARLAQLQVIAKDMEVRLNVMQLNIEYEIDEDENSLIGDYNDYNAALDALASTLRLFPNVNAVHFDRPRPPLNSISLHHFSYTRTFSLVMAALEIIDLPPSYLTHHRHPVLTVPGSPYVAQCDFGCLKTFDSCLRYVRCFEGIVNFEGRHSDPPGLAPWLGRRLIQGLNNLGELRELSLLFLPGHMSEQIFRSLSQGLELPYLKSVELTRAKCVEIEMIALLRRHSGTLREFHLDTIEFYEQQEEEDTYCGRQLIEDLHANFELTEISLEDLMYSEGNIAFAEIKLSEPDDDDYIIVHSVHQTGELNAESRESVQAVLEDAMVSISHIPY